MHLGRLPERAKKATIGIVSTVGSDPFWDCDMGGCVIRKVARKRSSRWERDRRVQYNLRVVTMLHNNVVNGKDGRVTPSVSLRTGVSCQTKAALSRLVSLPAISVDSTSAPYRTRVQEPTPQPHTFIPPPHSQPHGPSWKVQAAQV